MISTMWTDAPAGFAGTGGVALPAHACPTAVGSAGVRLAPTAAPIPGTGVPVAVRLRASDERGVAEQSSLEQAPAAVEAVALIGITHDNGTTLGIHPPGSPQS